jgi:hypothetical protein
LFIIGSKLTSDEEDDLTASVAAVHSEGEDDEYTQRKSFNEFLQLQQQTDEEGRRKFIGCSIFDENIEIQSILHVQQSLGP